MRWLRLWAAIAVALVGFSVSVGGAVAAPSWSSTFEFASGGSEPSVAIDAAGNAAVAWDEATIKVVTRPAGRRTWSAPTELAQGDGVEPTVAFDPAGHLFAAFGRGTFPRRYVQIATRPSLDGPWTVPITLSNPDDEDAGSPRLAFDPDGDVLVAWSAFDTKHADGGYFVQATFRPAGASGWARPVDVSPRLGNAPRGVGIALDRAGNAIAVWARAGPGAENPVVVASSRPAATGEWQPPVVLDGAFADVNDLQVGFDRAGNALAAWIGHYASKDQVQSSYRPVGGAWGEPEAVSDVEDLIQGGAFHLRVAPSGEAVALWPQTQRGESGVVASAVRPARSQRWQAPIALYKPTHGSYPSADSLGMDSAGDAVAVWSEPGTPLRAAIRPALGHWQPAQDAAPTPYPYSIDTAVDSNGNALAVWNGLPVAGVELKANGPILDQVAVPPRARIRSAAHFAVRALPWGSSPLAGSPTWSFGDGASASGQRTSHTYRRRGRYSVTVTARDATGASTRASRTITVTKRTR